MDKFIADTPNNRSTTIDDVVQNDGIDDVPDEVWTHIMARYVMGCRSLGLQSVVMVTDKDEKRYASIYEDMCREADESETVDWCTLVAGGATNVMAMDQETRHRVERRLRLRGPMCFARLIPLMDKVSDYSMRPIIRKRVRSIVPLAERAVGDNPTSRPVKETLTSANTRTTRTTTATVPHGQTTRKHLVRSLSSFRYHE